jgi:hypothetical protein
MLLELVGPRAVLKPCLKSETPYIACPDTKLRGLSMERRKS